MGEYLYVIIHRLLSYLYGYYTPFIIFVLRIIIERSIEVQKDLYLCYVDFQKAFDMVKHEQLMEMLADIGMDGEDRRMILNLYWKGRFVIPHYK